MATPAVLRSRDCLRRNPQFNHIPKPHNNRSRLNPEFNKNRIPVAITGPKFPNFPNKMVMGEVKILKRGDPLPEEKKIELWPVKKKTAAVEKSDSSDLILGSATRLGPEPDMVQKQIKVTDFNLAPPLPSCHFYAGSGPLASSPHPSCLPLPIKLSNKKAFLFP